MTQFFTRAHNLPVTIDRFNEEPESPDRTCSKCNSKDIGDENHYIFNCPFFSNERTKLLPTFKNGADNLPKAWKEILAYKGAELVNLGKFIRIITSKFKYVKEDDFTADSLPAKIVKTTRSGRQSKPLDRLNL